MSIENAIKNAQQRRENASQFSLSQIPLHSHNGNDAPMIPWSNISGKQQFIAVTLPGTSAATAGNYSVFFTAPYPITIVQITEVHVTAGSDGSAVSLDIEQLTGTTAPGSGNKLTATSFNLKATANTVVTKTVTNGGLPSGFMNLQISQGDRLALLLTGTPTSVANVTVTLLVNL